jgi:putative oligomerization/nucleic acid binding protein
MGLLGGIARTAVVAGTATAVSNRVSRRQATRWAQQGQEYTPVQRVGYTEAPSQAAAPPPAPAPAAAPQPDRYAQLKELAQLKDQGVLTEQEFAAEKQRILAG